VRALIVEDGRQRGALAACRALGRAGWTVGIGSPQRGGFAASSRWSSRWHRVPPPEAGQDEFVAATSTAIADGAYDVVFAAGDGEVLALSASREVLRAAVPYAAHEQLLRALDKLELAAAARRAGLGVPETRPAEEASAELDGPVIVKPRLTTVADPEGRPLRLRAVIARTPAEAAAQIDFLRSVGAAPLVQRYVAGPLTACIAVTDRDGRVLASIQQEAERVWPRGMGGSVRAKTVPVDEELARGVGALLAELEWFGLAQVQFQPGDDGEPLLIDLNARFYGSMALAVGAGPNLPAIWAALATKGPLPIIPAPWAGVRYQWLEADLRRAWTERRGGLVRDVRSCLAYARRARHGLWDRRDPWPALRHLATLAVRGLRKVR